MWKTIAAFEVRYQIRQPPFALSMLAFFGLGIVLASSDVGLAAGGAPGTTLRNAPVVVALQMPIVSLLGLFVITAFVTSAALRDTDRNCDMLFRTKPVSKLDYLGGRFLGSMAVSLGVLGAAVVGMAAGPAMPWQPPERLGPFGPGAYVFGLAVVIVPNLLAMGGVFFALAAWSRRLTVTFLAVVFFIGMQDAVEVLAARVDDRTLVAVLEPSGTVALQDATRYWSVAEQASRLPFAGGALLANRLAWLGFGLAGLALSMARFDRAPRRRRRPRSRTPAPEALPTRAVSARDLPRTQPRFGLRASLRQLAGQVRLETSEVLPTAPFLSLVALGLMFVVAYAWGAGAQDGMPSFPLTHLMLDGIRVGVRLALVLIVLLYAGELVHGQGSRRMSEVYDALPVSTGVLCAAKLATLMLAIAVFLAAAMAATVGVQLVKGPASIDLGLYVRGLGLIGWPVALVAVLALFLHVLADRRALGLALVAGVLVVRFALPRLGFENGLYLFGTHPRITYSAFVGYGHHLRPFAWMMAYWTFAAVVLAAGSLALWPRGTERSPRARLARARRRLGRGFAGAVAVGLAGMAATGAWIFVAGHLRADYLDRDRTLQRLADYETAYGAYTALPLPRVTEVFAEIDLHPAERRVEVRGRYRLENRGDRSVRELPITLSPRWVEGVLSMRGGATLELLDLPPHTVVVADERLGFHLVALETPLAPGEGIEMGFTVRLDHGAMPNGVPNELVVENGTFLTSRELLPTIGYARGNEIRDPVERRKRHLPPFPPMAEIGNQAPGADPALDRSYLEADWIRFETVVSVPADQVAISSGDLVEVREMGDRRAYRYRATAPMVHLAPFHAGRYAVARGRWRDVDIEVYHHPDHGANIDRFLDVAGRSLAYMTDHFGPYPHRQLRIVEIPRFHREVAFSLPQTIAYTEDWAWNADVAAGELDWLTAILAHEVAHQWWNHQVVPADVRGATWIAESLPQYAAMMVLRSIYGPDAMRRFLRFHLDRYLARRGAERRREVPLRQVENQAYIHYSKASLAFYALEDAIGEERLNRALRAFLAEHAFAGPPYPTADDLLGHLRRVVPDDAQPMLADLFETITLFDNRVLDATYRRQADGSYLVEIRARSAKLRDDGTGALTARALDDWVEIGVRGEATSEGAESAWTIERRRLRSVDGTFRMVLEERPALAGIDPMNKLVDRNAADNVRPVRELPRP